MIDRPVPAVHQQADMNEQELIQAAREAVSASNWTIGKCAHEWVQKFARGRTDQDFAELIGVGADRVRQSRNVWEKFGGISDTYPKLTWSHFYAALNWGDAVDCLKWADDMGASVREMQAFRRAQNGDQEDAKPVAESGECREGERAPVRASRNVSQATGGGEARESVTARSTDDAGAASVPQPAKKRATVREDANHSPDAGKMVSPFTSPPPPAPEVRPLSPSEVIVRIRELLKRAEKELEPDTLPEIGDELRSWFNKFAPVSDYGGKFKAPRNESERTAFVEKVRAYCEERKNGIDPEEFVDAHEKQGWKLSNGNPLKNWQAAIRTWERMRRSGLGPRPARGTVAEANAVSDERKAQLDEVEKELDLDISEEDLPF